MKKQTSLNFVLAILFLSAKCSPCLAQATAIRNGVVLDAGTLHLKAQFYAGGVLRVTKWTGGGTPGRASLSVVRDSIPDLGITVRQFDGAVLLKSPKMSARISTKDGNVLFLAVNDSTFLKEDGRTSFVPVVYYADSGFTVQQGFQLDPREAVYGLGEQVDGYMNFRGKRVVLAQANVGAANPFLVSTRELRHPLG
jgi:alpha-D-xyloside xylohydrolase